MAAARWHSAGQPRALPDGAGQVRGRPALSRVVGGCWNGPSLFMVW